MKQKTVCLLLLLLGGTPVRAKQPQAPVRPLNIVFLLADDLRWDALGCTGNAIARTPNIDRLAGQGVTFPNCFVTTSICAVSRASLFSGQYARRHGINDFATPFSAEKWARTYPAPLRQAGYRTGFIGKFGVGKDVKPMAAAFDYWRGLPGQAGPFFDPKDPSHTHATARFGAQALEFLRGCAGQAVLPVRQLQRSPRPRRRPREFAPDRRDEKLFAAVAIPVPKTAADKYFRRLPRFVQQSEGRARWKCRFATPEMFQKTVRDYYRLVTGIDREVGRIVALLRERKLSGNTLIVFTSDNGFFLGERGLAGKWLMYEASIRVPLIVFDPRLPRERRGRKVEQMALNIDLAPTLLDCAGVRPPQEMQGRSLLPLLRGDKPQWRSDWFYEHHTFPKILPPSEGVRSERWKYLRWVGVAPAVEELYDLTKDPLEEHNLAAEPEYAKTLGELRERWGRLRKIAGGN